jgi:hypothetical protein
VEATVKALLNAVNRIVVMSKAPANADATGREVNDE